MTIWNVKIYQKEFQLLIKRRNILISLFSLFVIFLIYSAIALSSHEHFLTFGWDLGYFDQVIWKVSHGIFPYSTLSKVNLLAGHFSPVLYLFAPLYWIWSDPKILLVAQSFLVVAAAVPLYLLSYEKTKSLFFSYAVTFSYLFFLGTQWTVLNEFHETSVVPLFLSLFFYAAEKVERNILLYLSIAGLLSTKEEISLLTAAMSFPLYFFYNRKKLAVFLFFFSVIFFFFLTSILMPAISEKGIYQHSHLSGDAKTPVEFVFKMISDPIFVLRSLVTPPDKIRTFFVSLASFAFLPILAPLPLLVPLAEQFLMRFLYTGPQFTVWQNVNHHAAPAAMLLPVVCILAVFALRKKFPDKKERITKAFSLLLLIATISQDIAFKAPVHSIFKKSLYLEETWMVDARKLILRIPQNASVATQNSLFPHLSQRNEIYLLPEINGADYIAVDLHDGPNKFAPLQKNELNSFLNRLTSRSDYKIEVKNNDSVLLKKSR